MFSRFIALLPLAAFAAVVAATPSNVCDSGSTYCCDQEFTNPSEFERHVDADGLIKVFSSLGVNGGIECSPITLIGALSNGAQCTKQTVCCNNVEQDGLVNIGCSPIAAPI